MPRPRKPSTKIAEHKANKLLDALQFLSVVTKEQGAPHETHIALYNKTATARNDTLSAGVLIDEELIAAPHNQTLIKALSKCGEQFALTELNQTLSIKSGKFKAIVPCIDINLLTPVVPDNPCAIIDDRFKEALTVIDVVKPELNAQQVHLLSFLLNGQSVITTDGKIILEYWHGIDLPIGMSIPKSLIPAITQNSKKLSKFGFSNSSVTFYFEDNSWIKSQLYADTWPDISPFMNRRHNAFSVPTDFFAGLEAVKAFSETGSVYFERELLCSHKTTDAGATFEVKGLPKGPIYTAKYLSMIKPYVDQIDFVVPAENGGYLLMFFGKNCRGVIAGHG